MFTSQQNEFQKKFMASVTAKSYALNAIHTRNQQQNSSKDVHRSNFFDPTQPTKWPIQPNPNQTIVKIWTQDPTQPNPW